MMVGNLSREVRRFLLLRHRNINQSRSEGVYAFTQLKINGHSQTVDVAADTPLLWVLRDTLNLHGTKYGCGIAQCGACTVLMGGEPVRSCSISVANMKEDVTTIEGLSGDGNHPLQVEWRAVDVPQCGYCQAGQILSAAALLKNIRSRRTRISIAR